MRGKPGSRFSKALSLVRQAFLEGLFVLDAASLLLHGAAPFLLQEGGSATGVPRGVKCELSEREMLVKIEHRKDSRPLSRSRPVLRWRRSTSTHAARIGLI